MAEIKRITQVAEIEREREQLEQDDEKQEQKHVFKKRIKQAKTNADLRKVLEDLLDVLFDK